MIQELEDPSDDGRPWYAVPRPMPQLPSVRRSIELSVSGGASFGIFVWSGAHEYWLRACAEGFAAAAFFATMALLARRQQKRRLRR
jgi:hypothetical protein